MWSGQCDILASARMWEGSAHARDADLGQAVLSGIRKQDEEVMGSKLVRAPLHGRCVGPCLQVPAMLDLWQRLL